MQLQLRLDLVNPPTPPPAPWDALTGEQQTVAVALLARLIAKMLLDQAKEADDAQ